MEENKSNPEELAACIKVAQTEQVQARNEFAKRLEALGFNVYCDITVDYPPCADYPQEEGKFISISLQSCYASQGNEFLGYFNLEVIWKTPHHCDDTCRNCREEWDVHREPARIEEVLYAIRKKLMDRLQYEEAEQEFDQRLAKSLPTAEEIAKIRRKVEDELRKNPKNILPVAKLLDII